MSPEITQEVVADVQPCPPLDVAEYPVIWEPPLWAGSVQEIVAEL